MEPENDTDLAPQNAEIEEPREAWHKRPDESQTAYRAFGLFRDSEKRRLTDVATALNCSVQNVFAFSQRHLWRQRVDAYDLHLDQEQRQQFARNRTRARERHRQLAVAMGGIAAHGIAEWQRKIAAGAELNLMPEQLVMLAKCACELEQRSLGLDETHQPVAINVLFGAHKYPHEQTDGEAEAAVDWRTAEQIEREQWDALDEQGRAALSQWRDPPKPQPKELQ